MAGKTSQDNGSLRYFVNVYLAYVSLNDLCIRPEPVCSTGISINIIGPDNMEPLIVESHIEPAGSGKQGDDGERVNLLTVLI